MLNVLSGFLSLLLPRCSRLSLPRLFLLKDKKNAKPQLAKHLQSQLRNESYHHGHFPIMLQDLCAWFVVIVRRRKEKLSICCWQSFLMKQRQKYCQGKMTLERPFRRERVADKQKWGMWGCPGEAVSSWTEPVFRIPPRWGCLRSPLSINKTFTN